MISYLLGISPSVISTAIAIAGVIPYLLTTCPSIKSIENLIPENYMGTWYE